MAYRLYTKSLPSPRAQVKGPRVDGNVLIVCGKQGEHAWLTRDREIRRCD
jgi:hypothetical protein